MITEKTSYKTKNMLMASVGVFFVLLFSASIYVSTLSPIYPGEIGENTLPNDTDSYNSETYNSDAYNPGSSLPDSAETPSIKYNLYLTSANPNPAVRGSKTLIHGYVVEFDEILIKFVPSVGVKVNIIIDGVEDPNINDITNSTGNFTLALDIPQSWNLNDFKTINATVEDPLYLSSCKNDLILTLSANVNIFIDEFPVDPVLMNQNDPGINNFNMSGHVEYDDGSVISDEAFNISIYFGQSKIHLYEQTIFGGYFSYSTWLPILNPADQILFIEYSGDNPVLLSNKINKTVKVFSGFSVSLDQDNVRQSYPGRTITIGGSVIPVNGEDFQIQSNDINLQLSIFGQDLPLTLDNHNHFSVSVTVPANITGAYGISVQLYDYQGIEINEFASSQIQINQPNITDPYSPNYIPFDLIGIIIGIIAAFIGIFILMRYRLKTDEDKWERQNVDETLNKLRFIPILLETGKDKEAIGYLYLIFTQLSTLNYKIQKVTGQTSNDFAIQMVREYGANPEVIYPFVKNIEHVLYGGLDPKSNFPKIKEMFKSLYAEIMGNVDVGLQNLPDF